MVSFIYKKGISFASFCEKTPIGKVVSESLQTRMDNFFPHIILLTFFSMFLVGLSLTEFLLKLTTSEDRKIKKLIDMGKNFAKNQTFLEVKPKIEHYGLTTFNYFKISRYRYLRDFYKDVNHNLTIASRIYGKTKI